MTAKKKTDDPKESTTQALPSDKIHVKLFSPFQVYYNGDAKSISAINDTGPFDVLPQHHSFITLLNACELNIVAPDGEKRVRISHGVMHVRNNQVTVFLDV
jgi:F0F1-type ATP synthase epsilon subunit